MIIEFTFELPFIFKAWENNNKAIRSIICIETITRRKTCYRMGNHTFQSWSTLTTDVIHEIVDYSRTEFTSNEPALLNKN
jgi:hypothetical protein